MSYSKYKFFFSSDEEGTFWPGVVELPVDNEVSVLSHLMMKIKISESLQV